MHPPGQPQVRTTALPLCEWKILNNILLLLIDKYHRKQQTRGRVRLFSWYLLIIIFGAKPGVSAGFPVEIATLEPPGRSLREI